MSYTDDEREAFRAQDAALTPKARGVPGPAERAAMRSRLESTSPLAVALDLRECLDAHDAIADAFRRKNTPDRHSPDCDPRYVECTPAVRVCRDMEAVAEARTTAREELRGLLAALAGETPTVTVHGATLTVDGREHPKARPAGETTAECTRCGRPVAPDLAAGNCHGGIDCERARGDRLEAQCAAMRGALASYREIAQKADIHGPIGPVADAWDRMVATHAIDTDAGAALLARLAAAERERDDLAMLVRRLARRLPEAAAAMQAMDYLGRKGLLGSPIRMEDNDDESE